MSEHTLEIDPDSTNVDLTCGICKKLMMDACQTVCGCQYCYRCISEFLCDGNKFCPGNKEDCKEEKLRLEEHVLKNSLLNKKILTAKVRCPNELCMCFFVLKEMEDHLRICTKQQTNCPFVQIGYGNERASKDYIVTHLQNEALIHSQLLIELIHNLKYEFDGLKDKFEIGQFKISSLEERLTIKDVQMEEIKLQTEEQKSEIGKQKDELKYLKEESLKNKEEELNKVRNEKTAQYKEIIMRMEDQKFEVYCMKEESVRKERAASTLNKEFIKMIHDMELNSTIIIDQTQKKEAQIDEQIWSINETMNAMKKKHDEGMYNGIILMRLYQNIKVDFVWKIDELKKKMDIMKEHDIYSVSFHSNFYKLCLHINMIGDGIGLYCHIMRGDNDDIVEWPMRLNVTLGIVNQRTLTTYKSHTVQRDCYRYCDDMYAFDRPKTDMSECGIIVAYPFIEFSSIKDDKSVVADDSIIVTCVLGDCT